VPPTLRKDMWQPLLTIIFPRGREHEGRIVYQRLREYRRFRDVNWRKRQDLLEHDAFSKTKFEPDEKGDVELIWTARQKLLMDQKADAIADVAAILERQKTIETQKREKIESETVQRDALKREKLKAAAEDGKVAVLESHIRNLKKALERGRGKDVKKAPQSEEDKAKWSRTIRQQIGRLNWEKSQLQLSLQPKRQQPVDNSPADVQKALSSVQDLIATMVKLRETGPPAAMKSNKQRLKWWFAFNELSQNAQSETKRLQILSGKSDQEQQEDGAGQGQQQKVDNLWKRKQELDNSQPEIYAAEADVVQIQWHELEDAYHAKSWPEEVVHDVMGRSAGQRHEAPLPYLVSKPGLSERERW
jgi:hypothetical protein